MRTLSNVATTGGRWHWRGRAIRIGDMAERGKVCRHETNTAHRSRRRGDRCVHRRRAMGDQQAVAEQSDDRGPPGAQGARAAAAGDADLTGGGAGRGRQPRDPRHHGGERAARAQRHARQSARRPARQGRDRLDRRARADPSGRRAARPQHLDHGQRLAATDRPGRQPGRQHHRPDRQPARRQPRPRSAEAHHPHARPARRHPRQCRHQPPSPRCCRTGGSSRTSPARWRWPTAACRSAASSSTSSTK